VTEASLGDILESKATSLQALDQQIVTQTVVKKHLESMPPGTRPGDPYTQIRIADQFVEANIENWRYNFDRKKWFHWNGRIWKVDTKRRIRFAVKNFLKEYLVLVPTLTSIGKDTVDLTRFIVSLNTAHGIRDILELSESQMPLLDEDLDTQDYYLNCANGTLDLLTHTFRPH